ncbi:hypothetical protein D6810_03055 [Candidatus Dojkabacteria bacterium]|uniref:Peptidase M3A/M3B catalytic domain-containing protein n=1 Tax=Candidatus Dojkabacteria bacterium TaxID=2099670 RepID=A0A3M0YZK6_9BACT|nr:MAG: hypothetical protein D6810_03055 [Candidatus Dojkabacteria bacterium]
MKNNDFNWDLNQIYQSIHDPRIDQEIEMIEKKWREFGSKYKALSEKLKTDKDLLKESLVEYTKLVEEVGLGNDQIFYLTLKNSIDLENAEIRARINKIREQIVRIHSQFVEFFILEIGKVPDELQKIILSDVNFKDYHTLLRRIWRTSKYNLSEAEERMFYIVSKTSSDNWADMGSTLRSTVNRLVLTDEGRKRLTLSEMSKYADSKNEKVRKSIFFGAKKINKELRQAAEFELNSILEFKRNIEDLRGIDDPEFYRLSSDDIEKEIVNTLIQAVEENFQISQRYYKLKAKVLGSKKLKPWNLNVDLDKLDHRFVDVDQKFPFERTVEIVGRTLKSLDDVFYEIFIDAISEHRLDAFPKRGKRGGAFCANSSKKTKSFILMNTTESILDVMTLAHECGHMIHNELGKTVLEIYYSNSLTTAEVSSIFFEDFAFRNAFFETEKESYAMFARRMAKIQDEIASVFLQISGYKFERQIHSIAKQKGYISAKEMDEIMLSELKGVYGDITDLKSRSDRWITWPHLRRPFYVYSYASGLLISKVLQSIVHENLSNLEKVKHFMKLSNSLSPKEIFEQIGLDISKKAFWEIGISEIKRELEEMEIMWDKIS